MCVLKISYTQHMIPYCLYDNLRHQVIMQYVVHAIRKDDNLAKLILLGKVDGKRSNGPNADEMDRTTQLPLQDDIRETEGRTQAMAAIGKIGIVLRS